VVPLASRCSVHCKSDITHKLNRNEATPRDILHTLHDSMANKVVSLLEKGQHELRRVLVIGGVSRNEAMLGALRAKLPATQFVALPQSPWFEAWGCALLARDEPKYRAPNISTPPNLDRLAPLNLYADRVVVIPRPPPEAVPDDPLVLGMDSGSTTTKAILLDRSTSRVVASVYTRTRGDPVAAARECVRALVDQVGNHPVDLVGTTGSARELVGAYLGTAHVYNEISAHAAGATHFDPDVDTIFEIGGQDSKYILLRNGVPIDYAMNNACSAGTGSFLEESAHGDLGITVSEIADIALAAASPVQFKATCAAFINSDIRIAQQQGCARDNIVAGLVYAIAANYLSRVKGRRSVGKKVFLQGGVALNRAVGHAFAHSVGREIVIPPSPELMGALGVALLAIQRSAGSTGPVRDLLSLAAPEMQFVGRFTCKACKMYCSIDRLEVAGRRFPFGGRCSLFENVWKRKSRTVAAPDLVQQRAELLFGNSTGRVPAHSGQTQDKSRGRELAPATVKPKVRRIGVPRALTTHSLYPLYSTFFTRLGMDVLLSGVDSDGDLKSYSGFCFPAQIAHGAVLDLAHHDVEVVFLPHVVRMPRANSCRDSYLCPITQAGPYFMAKAFPDIRFISPQLDFTNGYETSTALVEMAVRDLGVTRESARQAWAFAARAQNETELAMYALGQQELERAIADGQPAILLAGRSYNAFSSEGSQSVGKKLSSMGVLAIPTDCLVPVGEGPTAWHFANQIVNAMTLAKRHPNVFLLFVSNFSCTIDAFTQSMLSSEMGPKPYLILEIDAHTADAGVQTRLEAFLDIVHNYRASQPVASQPFRPCRLTSAGQVVSSSGERVPLSDPRVRLYLTDFSQYHARALARVIRWLGLRAGDVLSLDRSHLEKGLQFTSGRECLPLPICIGQLLHVHEHRQPGEISGLYMLQGGAPCVSDAYMTYFERFIAEQQLSDVFLFDPCEENDYCGFDKIKVARHMSPAILVADILEEIEQVVRVVGAPGSVDQLRRQWERFLNSTTSLAQFEAKLFGFVDQLAALPRVRDPLACPRVVVTGDFFTRFSPFFMEGVYELYAQRGIILKPVDLSHMFLSSSQQSLAETASQWGMQPGLLAFGKACTRAFHPDGQGYLQNWLSYQAESRAERSYRGLFRKTGLLVAEPDDISAQVSKATEHISPAIHGETIPAVGEGLRAEGQGYDGVILVGPFNCLPFRIAEAILKPMSIQQGMPLLTYESDGYPVSPSFLRQVDVHIQQVLEHASKNREAGTVATTRLR
jgi:predicted CoA-substrate-specific enzyme activase